MEAKYTIVITDKDLYESQKKGWERIEDSEQYKSLTDRMQEIVRDSLREYSKNLHIIMWQKKHIALSDGVALAAIIDNYTEPVPANEVKQAAIRLLARCPDDHGNLGQTQETQVNDVPEEYSSESFRENFIRVFGRKP